MKKSDLYREWARVLDMCEGTNVDPRLCWMLKGEGRDVASTPAFKDAPENYSFAVAIIDNKPVFVGDELYWKSNGVRFDWNKGLFEDCSSYQKNLSWQPPNKTFTLNGEELPCPVSEHSTFKLHVSSVIDSVMQKRDSFYFSCAEDMIIIQEAINKLLKDATK